MVGAVGHFTLQPMASTNHKFPGYGPGIRKEAKSTVVLNQDHITKVFQMLLKP